MRHLKMPRKYLAGLALVSAAIFLCACTSPERRTELEPGEWRQIAVVLEGDGTADTLVSAALIRGAALKDSGAALADLDRALRVTPQQPDAAWLALNICIDMPGCAQAPRGARLRELDPSNAAASYAALTEARRNGDVAAEDRALAAMADAKYFDLYWSRLLTRSIDTLVRPRGSAQSPLRDLRLASVEALGWLAAVDIPPFMSSSDTCKGDRLKRDDVADWCRKLTFVYDNSDTYIAQMFGAATATRVWNSESPERARFSGRQREYNYLREMTAPYDDTVHVSVEDTQRWLNRFRSNRSERDAYRAWLTELGIATEPPADWAPRKTVATSR